MSVVIEQTEAVLGAANLPPACLPNSDLAALIEQHQADVWRYLRYLGAEASDADDLTQETFLALSRSKFEQRTPGETAAYLRTVARNQLLMFRRFQGRQIDTIQLEAAEQVWAEAVNETGMDALLSLLADCQKTLEGRARQAVDLFYRARQGRTEIAATLQIKPEGVKTLLRRTRQALRDCIRRKTKRNV